MKTSIIILFTILFCSCKETKKAESKFTTKSKTWKFLLPNNLGDLEVNLSNNLDTFFTWTQYSDCGDPCNLSDYRIQNSTLPIFKESGFIYKTLKDSVEQFTFKHSKILKPWPSEDSIMAKMFIQKLKSEAYENRENKYLIDTILHIDNRKYAVIAYTSYDTTIKAKINILNAATSVKGERIEFYFEKRNSYQDKNSENFLATSLKSLNSIRLK